jgi:hypothetical protein
MSQHAPACPYTPQHIRARPGHVRARPSTSVHAPVMSVHAPAHPCTPQHICARPVMSGHAPVTPQHAPASLFARSRFAYHVIKENETKVTYPPRLSTAPHASAPRFSTTLQHPAPASRFNTHRQHPAPAPRFKFPPVSTPLQHHASAPRLNDTLQHLASAPRVHTNGGVAAANGKRQTTTTNYPRFSPPSTERFAHATAHFPFGRPAIPRTQI